MKKPSTEEVMGALGILIDFEIIDQEESVVKTCMNYLIEMVREEETKKYYRAKSKELKTQNKKFTQTEAWFVKEFKGCIDLTAFMGEVGNAMAKEAGFNLEAK